ncbi:DUF721 domain-containing protein [Candidatus Parcubacteria bacterium]|nr:MAG: DUF721 domain-containing protein [Candidatus Parcubacteria bacterium]
MQSIKNLLRGAVNRAGIKVGVEAAQAVKLFEDLKVDLLGAKMANQAKALSFRGGILRVRCNSSILIQELRWQEQKIIDELNRKLGPQKINKIIYEV